jgi:N-acetylneuraminate synthase
MIIDRQIDSYTIHADESLAWAVQKMCGLGTRALLVLSESGSLAGVLTDGDLRHWFGRQTQIDMNRPVIEAANSDFKFARAKDPPDRIRAMLGPRIQFVPILDEHNYVVGLAKMREKGFSIGPWRVEDGAPAIIIGEIGNNHNGSLALAKKLVDHCVDAGANFAKFQMRHLPSLYRNAGNASDHSEDLGSQYVLDLLSRNQLSDEQMFEVFDYCKERQIQPLCTPWDLESLRVLERYGMLAYKIASADLTNHELLEAAAATGKPLIVSTGMSREQEISEAVAVLQRGGANYVLLHCNAAYPAPFKDINLRFLKRLKELGDCPVGYSGHERGYHVVIAAVATGACVIEKHITVDRTMEGNDHRVSLLPSEFADMVTAVRELEEALGSGGDRQMSQGEMMNRTVLAKSLIINRPLKAGQIIADEMIEVRSPGKGLQPNQRSKLVGLRAKRDFQPGDFFYPSDLDMEARDARDYNFKRPWGLPVRYHDFRTLLSKSNPKLLEFHLSYKDLEVDVRDVFSRPLDLDLVVHAPELFAEDHILDLCSPDEKYREASIANLQRVIDVTRQLKTFFPRAERPRIIVNVGGFTLDRPLQPSGMQARIGLLLGSLRKLDTWDVELLPQTMPPFPWHMGGQRYHNVFVTPEQIVAICREGGLRVCLDVSHSKLACNERRASFKEFVDQVGPFTSHMHIADAKATSGEGLQIGEGDIDFPALAADLARVCPNASFIPEVWQGHTQSGEGFWVALNRLEHLF